MAPDRCRRRHTAHPGPGRRGQRGRQHARRVPSAPVKHVWYIDLENEGFAQSFGDPSADPYLATTLPRRGALLKNYFAIGHDSADNYIAQISGQAPDPATQNDCGVWTRFEPTNHLRLPFHQLVGNGCVYRGSRRTYAWTATTRPA
jgi:phosphatidylinositol-3-phosphatase